MGTQSSDGRQGSVDDAKAVPTTSDSDSASTASFQNIDAPFQTRGSKRQSSSREKNTFGADEELEGGDVAPNSPGELDDTTAAGQPTAIPDQTGRLEAPAPEDQRTKLQTALIVAALCCAVLLAALDVTITTVAIPTISADLNSTAGYTWIGSAYLLANAAAAPSWGKISDIFGRKPILLSAVGIFWVGSLICGLSVNMAMLIVGRAIQGIGGGGSLILVNICISDMFSVRKRGVYLGFVGMVWAVAGGFGPGQCFSPFPSDVYKECGLIDSSVLGGVFTTKATWRWCFYVNLPVAGVALGILYFTLKLHNPKTPIRQGLAAVDWLGSLTIVGGTLLFLVGLELAGNTYAWNSAATICLIVFGILVASMCVLVEMYLAKYPIIPARLFKNPRNLAILGLCACHGFVFISVSYYMPLYFQGVLGASALLSGVYVLPFTFVLGAMSAVAGFMIKKTGKYVPFIIGGFTLMTLGYGLFIDLNSYANWPKIILFQIVLGLGVGPLFQSPLIALQSGLQGRDIASATGTYMFVRQLSTSISIVVGGVIFDSGMANQADTLLSELDPQTAGLLIGNDAAASVTKVTSLSEPQRSIAQGAYWNALRTMFIFYVAFAGLGLFISFFVSGRTLSQDHTEHKTGLNTLRPGRTPVGDEEKVAGAEGAAAQGVQDGSTPDAVVVNAQQPGAIDREKAPAKTQT